MTFAPTPPMISPASSNASFSADDNNDKALPPMSPPISLWSPERSIASLVSIDQQQGLLIRRVYSFDEWNDAPLKGEPIEQEEEQYPPQEKQQATDQQDNMVFRFDDWDSDHDSNDEERYSNTYDDINDYLLQQQLSSEGFETSDDKENIDHLMLVPCDDSSARMLLEPLDTSELTLSFSTPPPPCIPRNDSDTFSSPMPLLELEEPNTAAIEECHHGSTGAYSGGIPQVIYVHKVNPKPDGWRLPGRWTRSWKAIVSKSKIHRRHLKEI